MNFEFKCTVLLVQGLVRLSRPHFVCPGPSLETPVLVFGFVQYQPSALVISKFVGRDREIGKFLILLQLSLSRNVFGPHVMYTNFYNFYECIKVTL